PGRVLLQRSLPVGAPPSVRLGVPVTLAPPAGVGTRVGCSDKAATPERGELIEFDRGPWARRSQAACIPRCGAHPRYAIPSPRNPGTDEHQLVHPSLPSQLPHLPNPRHSLRPHLKSL